MLTFLEQNLTENILPHYSLFEFTPLSAMHTVADPISTESHP